MRSKTLLLLIAGICGTVAAVGANSWMQAQGTHVEQPKLVEIFVAVKDIDLGEELTAENIKLEEWPVDRVPEGAMNELKELEGKFANQRLYEGEPLMKRKLMDTAGTTRRDIPEGYCVVSMTTDPASSVGTLVGPGDRVNVIGFFKKSEIIPQTTTQVVLTGVRIYAVDGRTTRSDEEEVGKAAKTISLLIPHKDEEAWTYANELGSIRLSLSRPDDSSSAGKTSGDTTSGQQFLSWIAEYQNAATHAEAQPTTLTASSPPPMTAEPAPPVRMVKLGSEGGIQVYEQRDGMFVPVEPEPQAGNAGTAETKYSYLNGSESPFFENDGKDVAQEVSTDPPVEELNKQ